MKKILPLILVCSCLLHLGGSWFSSGTVYINGRLYRNIARLAPFDRMYRLHSGKKLRYSDSARNLLFELSSRRMYWNGMCMMLGYPVVQHRGGFYVSDSDWRSTLGILFYPGSVPNHRMFSITIDAGHGGNDRGASGRFSHEKNITLKLAKRVAAILRNCRYQVHLTRSGDTAVLLKQRSDLQRRQRTDLFVSIHVNAAKDSLVTGIETYCLTPADAPSSNGKPALQRNPGNLWDPNNFMLACQIQNALLSRTKAVDRGVKRARFAVLRDISAPGVLTEIGFISNPQEEKLLNQPDYQEKLARGIAQGIIAYHQRITRR